MQIEEELSFDAWGNRRNASEWTYNNLPTSFMFDRGYTGHEQLDVFGLINMNGRMYDPKLGRMLSPDIVVQDGGNTQSYNRYSYCNNNLLMFTDPSGFLNEGGSQYSTNNAMAENARLRAMYSDAVDAIYAAANASGAGNMYGIWEEGKLSIYTYSDIGNFREIGSVNEAMGANSQYTGGVASAEEMRDAETSISDEEIKTFGDGPLKDSFLFPYSKENQAYKFLWRISHDSNGNWTSESFGILTNKGVLILPNVGYINGEFLKNGESEAYYAEKWLEANVNERKINGTDLKTIATIHTHPWVDQISGGDKTLYKFGNIYVLDKSQLWFGFRTSNNSNIKQGSVASFEEIMNNVSIYNNNKLYPYYPY